MRSSHYGKIFKGRTLPYGTLANASLELRSVYYRYMREEDLPPMPDIEPDPVGYYEPEEEHELLGWVLKAVADLTRREQLVIAMRFLQEFTLEECGVYLDVTRERIRQIEAKALRKIKRLVAEYSRQDDRRRKDREYEYKTSRMLARAVLTIDGRVV